MTYTVFTHPPYTNPSSFATGIEFESLQEAQKYAREELQILTGQEPEEVTPTQFETEKMWASIYDELPY